METTQARFGDRLRFNWGFWEGRDCTRRKVEPLWRLLGGSAPTGAYADGYERGLNAEHATDPTSDRAWAIHRAEVDARRARKRALRDARPSIADQRF